MKLPFFCLEVNNLFRLTWTILLIENLYNTRKMSLQHERLDMRLNCIQTCALDIKLA